MIQQSGIPCAADRDIFATAISLPTMRTTITSWFRPLVVGRVTKTVVNFEVKELFRETSCLGVIQPFGPAQLRLKPEGQRSWEWKMLHTTPDIHLENDERFTIAGTPYRVMKNQDYSEYGYMQYELVQDYKKAPNVN
jgi:hypothetical protein